MQRDYNHGTCNADEISCPHHAVRMGEPCVAPTTRPYFRPNANVTRGQLAKIIGGAAGFTDRPETPDQQTFADVPPTQPFYRYIEQMSFREIIGGYPCGTNPNEPCDTQNRPYFRPGSNATRGQIAKIVALTAQLDTAIPADKQTFTDVPSTSTFRLYIKQLYLSGAINGYACGSAGEPCDESNRPYFRVGANTTRGQLTKIVQISLLPGCNLTDPQ